MHTYCCKHTMVLLLLPPLPLLLLLLLLLQLLWYTRIYLKMSGDDPTLLVVSGRISCQLEDFRRQVLQDCGQVHGSARTNTFRIIAYIVRRVGARGATFAMWRLKNKDWSVHLQYPSKYQLCQKLKASKYQTLFNRHLPFFMRRWTLPTGNDKPARLERLLALAFVFPDFPRPDMLARLNQRRKTLASDPNAVEKVMENKLILFKLTAFKWAQKRKTALRMKEKKPDRHFKH